MSDHLGVNDIPKAKSLENNDRSTALTVNDAGTSPRICAETVPPRGMREAIKATHSELDRIGAAFPDREDVADRIRGARHSLRLIAGGDTSPEIMGALSKRVADLHRVTREGGQ
jgi:hypothetical protein